jgi:hypothetical protein
MVIGSDVRFFMGFTPQTMSCPVDKVFTVPAFFDHLTDAAVHF